MVIRGLGCSPSKLFKKSKGPMKITTLVQIRKINGNNNKLDKKTNKQTT